MHELSRQGKIGFEDLMRELASVEQKLMNENPSLAMALMVMEAKLRERFQRLEYRVIQNDPTYHDEADLTLGEDITMKDLEALFPGELPPFPTIQSIEEPSRKKRIWGTVGLAALLAIFTALGVFGLASLLHLGLNLIA